jgi:hypothetical protein
MSATRHSTIKPTRLSMHGNNRMLIQPRDLTILRELATMPPANLDRSLASTPACSRSRVPDSFAGFFSDRAPDGERSMRCPKKART